MELLPGERIPELLIAEKFSLSRTPIHDALRHLAADGLVTISRNRGAAVRRFSAKEVREIGTIRLSQDILSAKLASYYGNTAAFDHLRNLAEANQDAAAKGNIYLRIKIDNDFHLEIAKISGNQHLYNLQYELYQQIYLVHILRYIDIKNSLIQIGHHLPLVEAIRKADMDRITQLICEHLKDFYQIDSFILTCFGYIQDNTSSNILTK
jgi:DNA-binding GntR family transcriptional regulator